MSERACPNEECAGECLCGFDPCQEGGGGRCERCGYEIEPCVYSRLCQGCTWDEMGRGER